MMLAEGERLNHYQILSPLGAGGMGVVYLAEDMRLRRKVALKLLPEAFTRDPQRLRRFEQEARAASALNHPNILTIFEIGQAEGTHFIATEFIDGQTLRERLRGGAVPIPEALDLAAQITAALAAAHEAGIVHRDIKPENVMVRRDGIAKVLDFGLAKLTESPTSVESEAPTIAQVNTDPGTVLGTASYMSPEQARGQEADARSDLFSLGVMLYEVIAGQAPFGGANVLEIVSEILKTEPAPLRQLIPDVPSELQRIVTKTLRKDREQRYQHAKDLLIDLKDLKQELEFEAKLKGAPSLGVPPSGGSAGALDLPPEGGTPNATPAARTTSSAEIILGEIKRHRTGVLIGMVVLLVAAGLLGYGIYRFASPKGTVARFQNVKFTRLTSVGNVRSQSVSVSPDGKFIAYVQRDAGRNSLWTKAIATGSAVQIISPTENDLLYTTFSPDGNYVYYQQREGQVSLYQIPVLGGTPRKVLSRINSPITFSPDGRQLAFLRPSSDRTISQLTVVNADGSGERILAERQSAEPFFSGLAWSPDGKTIVATAYRKEGEIDKYLLLSIAVDSGETQLLVEPKYNLSSFFDVKWLKDSNGLLLTATQNRETPQIWNVSYPDGKVRRITNDFAIYSRLSLTADNSALITDQAEVSSKLWVTPLGPNARPQQITQGNNREGYSGVRWTPDGRIVYTSGASGQTEVWVKNADGRNAKQITNALGAAPTVLAVSPDGRYLIFSLYRLAKTNVWRVDLDGGNLKQLTASDVLMDFDLSPDGRWVVFVDRGADIRKLYKVSIEGGDPVQLNEGRFSAPVVSPDGKWIACLSFNSGASQRQVAILPFEGGPPVKTFEGKFVAGLTALRWAGDGRALLYVDARQGSSNIWRLPLDGSSPQPVTNFKDAQPEEIYRFDVSRDGKQLVIARGYRSADAVMISEVK